MIVAALFTIVKKWRKPKCPSTGEWIWEMYYIHTHTHTHTHTQKGILLSQKMPFAATWMDLEIIIISKVSQTKTNII